MNIERGIRRIVVVVSGLILALGVWAVVEGSRVEDVAAFVVIGLSGLWVAFFTLRWVVRGFLREPEPAVRRPRLRWKVVKDWSVIGICGATLAYVVGRLLWALWEGLRQLAVTWPAVIAGLWEGVRQPAATWHAVVTAFLRFPLVIWLRQTVGDQGAAMIGLGFAALMAFGLASEWQSERVRRRQGRAYRRLKEHYAACQACQQLSDDDALPEAARAGYCPVGQQLHTEWERS